MNNVERRTFFKKMLSWTMMGGFIASGGFFGNIALRFLYPARFKAQGWVYVAQSTRIPLGGSLSYQTPDGMKVEIARLGGTGKVSDFVALSSVCPHLGCMVRWEAHNNRFFCPCHNGVFDALGNAIAGPPFKAKQKLTQFPLKIKNNLLFIYARLEK